MVSSKVERSKLKNNILMRESFVDRGILEEAADNLLKMRDYSHLGVDEYNDLRDKIVEGLDEKIGDAIFNDLNDDQLDEIEALLTNDEVDEKAFDDFFAKHQIDLKAKIEKGILDFKENFLMKGVE